MLKTDTKNGKKKKKINFYSIENIGMHSIKKRCSLFQANDGSMNQTYFLVYSKYGPKQTYFTCHMTKNNAPHPPQTIVLQQI